jgi:ribosomal protein S5
MSKRQEIIKQSKKKRQLTNKSFLPLQSVLVGMVDVRVRRGSRDKFQRVVVVQVLGEKQGVVSLEVLLLDFQTHADELHLKPCSLP